MAEAVQEVGADAAGLEDLEADQEAAAGSADQEADQEAAVGSAA